MASIRQRPALRTAKQYRARSEHESVRGHPYQAVGMVIANTRSPRRLQTFDKQGMASVVAR